MGGLEVVGRTYRHLNRYREVVGVLAKHGFGDLLHVVRLDRAVDLGVGHRLRLRPAPAAHERPERVRRVLEDLGPTFVKAGQYLSTRADLIPEEYLREMTKLQDAVPPFPAEDARRIVAEELGAPVERLFKSFAGRPLAAASIAQVHEAVTVGGARVVVKVERPDIRARVEVDLEIMAHLAALAEHHLESWRWRRPTRVVAEIARSLDRELDLAQEASHAERFARQFEDDPTVRAPRVVRELSTSRVLTLERLDGIKADDKAALERAGLDPREIAERLGRHYLAMFLVHGFFHADPHPGNLLAMPDGAIGYLDFGMAGRLGRATREALADVMAAVAARDEAAAARGALALAEFDEEVDLRAFEADVGELMDQYAYRPLAEWRLGRMLEQFLGTAVRHRLRIPPDLFLVVKTVTELESLARALDPRFDAVASAAPLVRWVQEERLRPKRLGESLAAASRETLDLLATAPGDLREILRRARRGRLTIEFEHKGLSPALSELDQVGSRLSFAVVLAALVVGSSLLLRAQVPPYWNGVSVLGLAGYCLSGLMSVWLLAAILRHGRL